MTQMKSEILTFFNDLEFDKEYHQYYVNNNKIEKSVSGVINNFVEPFNKYAISKAMSESLGIAQQDILDEWDSKREKACNLGNETHLFGELYPFNRHIKPTNKFEEAVVKFWADIPTHIIPVLTEIQMYHKGYMYAGTADILLYNTITGKYIIADYKTNEDLFKNYKGKTLLKPFEHLLDCPFSKYILQLSFYQILFEQIGYEVESRRIIWLRPTGEYEMYETEDYTQSLYNYLNTNGI